MTDNFLLFILLTLCILIPVLTIQEKQYNRKIAVAIRAVKNKRNGGNLAMSALIERYIGRECMVYTLQGQLSGRVELIDGNWVQVRVGKETEIVNLDFICRVRALPNRNPILSVEDLVAD